jgi:hypothetical protein
MTTSLCFIQMETQRFTLLNQLVERWENQQGKQCRSGKPSNDTCGERNGNGETYSTHWIL